MRKDWKDITQYPKNREMEPLAYETYLEYIGSFAYLRRGHCSGEYILRCNELRIKDEVIKADGFDEAFNIATKTIIERLREKVSEFNGQLNKMLIDYMIYQ